MSFPALECHALDVRYGRERALAGINFSLRRGTTVALLGVNGAGKSTLLKTVLDFVPSSGGELRIFGQPHHKPSARTMVAFLGDRFQPPSYVTGRELLDFLCRLHGGAPEPRAVEEECAALGLDPQALGSRVREYSLGMTQKLGLIACLLVDRPLLLLDEPLRGLDPEISERLLLRLARLKARGTTVFFSTHGLREVAELCDDVVMLEAGRLHYAGSLAGFAPTGDLRAAFRAHRANLTSEPAP